MQLQVGNVVIHPHHGPATVTGSLTRMVRGQQTDYMQLEVHETRLTVSVPCDKADEIGIREIAGARQLSKLAEVLCGPTGQEETQWSRRYKANREALASGDQMKIATVVRNLVRRRERGSLSLAEKDLLKEASAPLVAEIMLAVNVEEARAREVIHTLIITESSEVLDQLEKTSA